MEAGVSYVELQSTLKTGTWFKESNSGSQNRSVYRGWPHMANLLRR